MRASRVIPHFASSGPILPSAAPRRRSFARRRLRHGRASRGTAGCALFARQSGRIFRQQSHGIRPRDRGRPSRRRRPFRLRVELQRVRREPRVAVSRGPERRPPGEPLRRDEEGERADRAQLQPPVPAADDGPSLLHGLRAMGPSRHGADAVHESHSRGAADPRVQRREDAPRLHLRGRHRGRHRAGDRPPARCRRGRRRAVRDLQHRQSRGRRRSKRSSPHSRAFSAGPRSANTRRCSRATFRRRSRRSTVSLR